MTEYRPMAHLPETAGYKAGDVLVVVGELFGRGYATGLVEEARRIGMTIIGTTMGRRDADGTLRALNAEELAAAEELLGGRIINIPLEAGFDSECVDGQPSVAELLKKAKPETWESIEFDDRYLEQVKASGTARFRANLTQVVQELEGLIPAGSTVLFSCVMAGGFPRARIFMVLLNRVFKGTGDKYLASRRFWESGIGRLCAASFNEVSADTFRYLLDETAVLRQRLIDGGGTVRYSAYGYHGTGVLVDDEYCWQSYIPYMPGWAKMRLEQVAAEAVSRGITATVFNCPEIQTNSSSLFLGVEIPLYRLLAAVRREAGETVAGPLYQRCQELLADGVTVEQVLARAEAYLASPVINGISDFATWPQHNTPEQAELMLTASAELMAMQADQKPVVCAELSRVVFLATGKLILHGSWNPEAPVLWLNHDIIARLLADSRGADIL